ncbi:MAG: Asp-tRNA(Asn)/Glu-tRNA(Gln) amidotransferase subunit GatB [Spirochaetales bacterium]|nr:Asp-tRNA(Asn)/Glu-tRNA(Gln) amidotransferase subunit GatB [Spirochaetales bacterium]
MKYDVVIGCEVHVQLLTKTKAFCGCENRFGGIPNTRACPVCLGLPGALPVVNQTMVEYAILAGLALNCKVASVTKFDRKNYMYPDLPKGYQISQFDMPICTDGRLSINTEKGEKDIRIIRLHMEEDAGKNLHLEDGSGLSYVDFNRCGTPLLEIVSEPDMRSPEEAVLYVQGIREIMQYLGISDCNMEEGSLRCDANINLWIYEDGKKYETPISEVKNMNSFKAMKNALQYETKRQLKEWEEKRITLKKAGKVTRGFNDKTGKTVVQRDKEEEADYRYFPEPDLKPIRISKELVEKMKSAVGELPKAKRARFASQYGLQSTTSAILSKSKALADYFEKSVKGYREPSKIASWIITELGGYLNSEGLSIEECPVLPKYIRELMELVDRAIISSKIAKDVFSRMTHTGKAPGEIVDELGLSQITDRAFIEELVVKVMSENPKSVKDYRGGKDHALKFLMGQVMKETKGKANPQRTAEILREKLKDG